MGGQHATHDVDRIEGLESLGVLVARRKSLSREQSPMMCIWFTSTYQSRRRLTYLTRHPAENLTVNSEFWY